MINIIIYCFLSLVAAFLFRSIFLDQGRVSFGYFWRRFKEMYIEKERAFPLIAAIVIFLILTMVSPVIVTVLFIVFDIK